MADSSSALLSPAARFWAIVLILLGVAFITFHGVLQLGFLGYDDNDYVLHNPHIYPFTGEKVARLFWTPYFRSYTPLTLLSHAIDFEVWGKDPFGHHLTNLLLHLANTLVLFLVCVVTFRLLREGERGAPRGTPREFVFSAPLPVILAAAGGAALFSLNPLRVESVAWVSDRKDLLMTFFVLLSILGYLFASRFRETAEGKKWYRISAAAGLLGMLAKTVGTMLPVVLLLLDGTLLAGDQRRRGWGRLIREKWWFFLCSLLVGILSLLAMVNVRRHPTLYAESTLEKILLPFFTWAFYLWKSVLPTGLTPIYSYPPVWQQLISILVMVGAVLLAIWLHRRKKGSFLIAALGFFFLFLLPTILGREKAGIQPWADRYSYLPAASLGVLAGGLLLWAWERRTGWIRMGVWLAAGVVLCCFGALSFLQVPIWRDTETLFRHAVAVNPRAVFAQANLGMALTAAGKSDEAIAVLSRSIELSPMYAGNYAAMGLAYSGKGEDEAAAREFRRALELDSNFVDAHSNLGSSLMALGKYDDAIVEYEKAIRKEPAFDDAYYNMGIATYRKGDPAGAMEIFRKTAEINPIRPDTYVNMGIIYREWGKLDSAYVEFSRAASLGSAKAAELIRSWNVVH